MLTVSCKHLVVEYSREEVLIDGKGVIAHKFPCAECDASALLWDDDFEYDIE